MRTINNKDQQKKKAHLDAHVAEYVLQTNEGTDMQLTMGTVLKAFVVAADSRLYKPMAFAE